MLFSDVLTQVYRILEDTGQFAWPNSAVALHLQDAVRDVANQLGSADARITLDLAQGTANYLLPVGVRRVNNIRILPEIPAGGTQAEAGPPLKQDTLAKFPVVSVQDAEPRRFAMSAVAGATQEQFEILFHPTPQRSATGGIIVNYGIEYPFTSPDPADQTALDQQIPFPSQYDKVIYYKTAGGMLSERTDQADIEKGEYFNSKAERLLKPMLPVKATEAMVDECRAFP